MNDQGKGEIRAARDKTEDTLKTKGERTVPSRSSNAAEMGVQRPATQRALAGQSTHAEKGDRVHLGTRLDTENVSLCGLRRQLQSLSHLGLNSSNW